MSPSVRVPVRARGALLAAALGAVALAGCGTAPAAEPAAPAAATAAAPTTAEVAPAAAQPAVTVSDPWVKAAEGGMTAVFGTFTATGAPVTVVSAATSASPRTELHEVLMKQDGSMAMQPKDGGITVEPGSPHQLAPGGDHIMIMDLASPIRPGDSVEVTLTLDDGSTVGFSALAKETTAGEENYEHGETDPGAAGMPGMTGAAPAGQGG